jgi:hypothetical protein
MGGPEGAGVVLAIAGVTGLAEVAPGCAVVPGAVVAAGRVAVGPGVAVAAAPQATKKASTNMTGANIALIPL